jgi:hypothetical protein
MNRKENSGMRPPERAFVWHAPPMPDRSEINRWYGTTTTTPGKPTRARMSAAATSVSRTRS